MKNPVKSVMKSSANSTYQSIIINQSIDVVWARINNFHNMSWAPNVISNCIAVGDLSGNTIGAKAILNDDYHETLIEWSEDTYHLAYSVDDSPSPVSPKDVSNYVGVVKLTAQGSKTKVEWTSSWEGDCAETKQYCHELYVELLEDMALSLN